MQTRTPISCGTPVQVLGGADATGGRADHLVLDAALHSLVSVVKHGRVPRLALERIDGEPVVGSPFAARLLELGFRAGPRRLTLDRSRP